MVGFGWKFPGPGTVDTFFDAVEGRRLDHISTHIPSKHVAFSCHLFWVSRGRISSGSASYETAGDVRDAPRGEKPCCSGNTNVTVCACLSPALSCCGLPWSASSGSRCLGKVSLVTGRQGDREKIAQSSFPTSKFLRSQLQNCPEDGMKILRNAPRISFLQVVFPNQGQPPSGRGLRGWG
jgi:hypothetical protein